MTAVHVNTVTVLWPREESTTRTSTIITCQNVSWNRKHTVVRVDREQRRGWRKWRWNVHWPEWDLGCHHDQSQLAVTYEQTKNRHTNTHKQREGEGVKKKEKYNKGSILHAVSVNWKQQKDRCEWKREGRPCGSLLRRHGHECRCGWRFRQPGLGSALKGKNKPVTYTRTWTKAESLTLASGKIWKTQPRWTFLLKKPIWKPCLGDARCILRRERGKVLQMCEWERERDRMSKSSASEMQPSVHKRRCNSTLTVQLVTPQIGRVCERKSERLYWNVEKSTRDPQIAKETESKSGVLLSLHFYLRLEDDRGAFGSLLFL